MEPQKHPPQKKESLDPLLAKKKTVGAPRKPFLKPLLPLLGFYALAKLEAALPPPPQTLDPKPLDLHPKP